MERPLGPALPLAAKSAAGGDRRAVGELIRVLDRLGKRQATGGVCANDEGAHERRLTRLDTMKERMKRVREAGAAARDVGPEESLDGAGAESPDFTLPSGISP